MNTKLLAIGVAALLVTAGAAVAAPGNAPADAPAGDHANQPDDASAADGADANASDDVEDADANASAAARGPPVDMPDQVPDHVIEIHRTIDDFLGGAIDDLGGALHGLLGGGADNGQAGSHGPNANANGAAQEHAG